MNKRKATSDNKAAPVHKAKSIIKTISCERQKAVLSRLLVGECTVRELQKVAGNNPAETVRQLRNRGVKIGMTWHNGRDKYGKKCRFGKYALEG